MPYIPEWLPLTPTEVQALESFRQRSVPTKGIGVKTIDKLKSRELIKPAGRDQDYGPLSYSLTAEGDAAIKITAMYSSGKFEHDRRRMNVYRQKVNLVQLLETL